MALLDFMKQGTQWLTDNTGMDWNTVQRDPGMAAKRLMGGPVDLSSQQQYQQSQNNLLDAATPNEIVAAPEMQNRMTYNTQPQPDMSAVNQYSDFNYIPSKKTHFYDKAESEITRQKDYIPVSEGGAKLQGASSQGNACLLYTSDAADE